MSDSFPEGPIEFSDIAPGSDGDDPWYGKLSPQDRVIATISTTPRLTIYLVTMFVCLLGWLWLSSQVAGIGAFGTAEPVGPGMVWLSGWLASWIDQDNLSPTARWLLALCTPGAAESTFASFLIVTSMWLAMSIAMMLPSAAPMFRTYGDIAEAAKRKGEETISLTILVAGYLSVWGAFSLVAAVLQLLFVEMGQSTNAGAPVSGILGGLILIGAGAYQLSNIKEACLEKCRNPFTTLFGNWQTTRSGVFRLGLQQ